ncbi:MAG: HD domain-containing protein [bacterium]
MKNFSTILKEVNPILSAIIDFGGVPYLVGGTVRDFILNLPIKDVDIEIHKISLLDIEKILKKFGIVRLVGKQFGVLRIDGIDIDWSLPRKDSIGRKPKVEIDSQMTIKDALRRRDITMNAMAVDLSRVLEKNKNIIDEDQIIDPFGGLKDIKNKVLRVVDQDLFLQDPLRFFRVMQFVGRFEMNPDEKLNSICKQMDLVDFVTGKKISRERIFEELKKLFLKSKKPSLAFKWLNDISKLKDIFPEIYALIGVEQKKDYHPEGDVFEHTMQSIDAAAIFDEYESQEEKLLIILSVLCHDFGKPQTTDESLSAKGHEQVGVKIAKKFLKKITDNKNLIDTVGKLVLYHIRPSAFVTDKSKLKAYKRLAQKLAPQTNMRQLALVALFDKRGRNKKKGEPLKDVFKNEFNNFLKMAKDAQIDRGPEKAVLRGKDILDIVKPGPEMGRLLKSAYKIQIEENIKDKEELKKRVLK